MTCEVKFDPSGAISFACSRGQRAKPHTHTWRPTLDPAIEQCTSCRHTCRHTWVAVARQQHLQACTQCHSTRPLPEEVTHERTG